MKSDMERVSRQRPRFFVDTSVLISLINENESESILASKLYEIIKENNGILVVSSLVMSEYFVILSRKGYEIKKIEESCKLLLDSPNFVVMNISDSQLPKVLSRVIESGVNLRSSDLYLSATAIFFDCTFLTLDREICTKVSEIYENVFYDPEILKSKIGNL